MLAVTLVSVCAWVRFRQHPQYQKQLVPLIAILAVGMTVLTGSIGLMVDFPLDSDRTLRVLPSTMFPLTMQQFRDYEAHQFSYRIVVGWPDGIPIYESELRDDRGESFMWEHLSATVVLGAYALLGWSLAFPIIIFLEKSRPHVPHEDDKLKQGLYRSYVRGLMLSVILFCVGIALTFEVLLLPFTPSHVSAQIGLTMMQLGWISYICSTLRPV